MNKQDIINIVAEKMEATKKETKEYIDCVFDTLAATFVSGESVRIAGFGNFDVIERAERNGHNPSTGESIVIPASKALKFKPSSVLKDSVKKA